MMENDGDDDYVMMMMMMMMMMKINKNTKIKKQGNAEN